MSLQFLKPASLCFLMLALGVPLSAQAQHFHELDKNFCILKIGPYGMHLTGYQPDNTGRKETCGEVPGTGRTVLVLDYIEGELRSLPVEVRVIRDTGSEQDLQAITVLHLPPKVYPGGFISFEYSFDQPGKFVGLVIVGGTQEHVARFPISIGESTVVSHFMHYIMVIVPLAAIAGGAAIFFFLRGRRNTSDSTVS
ncbi:MAG: hypothetical protein ACREIJ_07245 [Nitrospiraceae bacterium]